MIAGGAMGWPLDCSTAIETAGGGGTAASSIRQPMEQELLQSLLLSPAGACRSRRGTWQMTVSEAAASAIAVRTAPKLTIRPASAIA